MNDIARAEAVRKLVKPKFYGHKTRVGKVKPFRPENLEREYVRLVNAYMKILKRVVTKHMPKINAVAVQARKDSRYDAARDFWQVFNDEFDAIAAELMEEMGIFAFEQKLNDLAYLVRKLNVKQWKKVCEATLGINILEDYYLGGRYMDDLKMWTFENVNMIKTVPQETLNDIRQIVHDGYLNGRRAENIAEDIQDVYDVGLNRAQFIARDQMAKLNADITQKQQTDAGVSEYIWSSSGDSRVRACHHEFDGHKFKWSDPPENWYDTKRGKVYTGRAHPGESFQCLPGDTKVNFSNGCDKLIRRMYSGPVFNVVLSDGTLLQATPNHPCLTVNGWLPVNALNQGDNLIQCIGDRGFVLEYNGNEFIPCIANSFETLGRFCSISKAGCSVLDFHGDGLEGNVDIVDVDGFLTRYFISERFKAFEKFIFPNALSYGRNPVLNIDCPRKPSFSWVGTLDGFVSFMNEFFSFLEAQSSHPDNIGFATAPSCNSVVAKDCRNNYSFGVESLRQGKLTLSGNIPFDYLVLWQLVLSRLFPVRVESDVVLAELVRKSFALTGDGLSNRNDCFTGIYTTSTVEQKFVTEFAGHVYNLQNSSSWYSISQSRTVAHNCRCVARPVFDFETLDLPI